MLTKRAVVNSYVKTLRRPIDHWLEGFECFEKLKSRGRKRGVQPRRSTTDANIKHCLRHETGRTQPRASACKARRVRFRVDQPILELFQQALYGLSSKLLHRCRLDVARLVVQGLLSPLGMIMLFNVAFTIAVKPSVVVPTI
jgi:hypothetical protein